MSTVTEKPSITGHDQYLFREGTHTRLYEKLGVSDRAAAVAEGMRRGLIE